jgi:hypothetical protein
MSHSSTNHQKKKKRGISYNLLAKQYTIKLMLGICNVKGLFWLA